MLASTIFGYHDIAGDLHYRLNAEVASDDCSELTAALTCDTSHITPERQLVENVFALDDCSLLATKIFSNSDNDWVDYEECGEVPQSLMQMLARCIVTYSDTKKINAVLETAACTEIEALLDCDVNDIEAERMLVKNIFTLDDCGNLLIKLFTNSSTFTDYNTACAGYPQSLLQMLARCIILYDGNYFLNVASVSGYCDDLHAFWTCNNNHIPPERALVENIFATDSCDIMAVKLFNNQGEGQ